MRKQSPQGEEAFFEALARGLSVVAAAPLAGCTRQALYRRRICDHDFDRRWREIELALTLRAKARLRRRKRLCVPIFESGRLTDGQLLARLKSLRPEKVSRRTGL